MGLYNAVIKLFIFFSNVMPMQKKIKYAKAKIIHAMLKVNIDNYRCYLLARVQTLKSPGQDFSPILFIPRVHMLVLEMATLMVAPLVLVILMMISPSPFIPAWSLSWT
jgi:hypothetical protein